ncbi:myxosortase MrtC [Pendulispora albinea]|uniref:MrtC family glutamic-type intramembrane protease n=1 Tax=Pendulispora albinea TaxID=2741071 RepID=A0ABZ2LNN8_9BACT
MAYRVSPSPTTPERPPVDGRAILEALGVSAVVTLLVTVAASLLPDRYVASAVGFTFLGATWWLVWSRDDARVAHFGLAFGGLVLPGKLDIGRLVGSFARALGWAVLFAAITFVPFWLGWRWWWRAAGDFHLRWETIDPSLFNELLGQLLIIALPEEAFYRGYLQTRLDDAIPARVRILGASVTPGLVIASIVFALGHFATIRTAPRLAVFFPALVFGWLRARTGGVGAGILFHATCNMFSMLLGRGYGVY